MNPKPQQTEAGTFWSELRRRGVVRAGGVYVAAAFVVLQLGEIVLPAFNAPDWVLQSLVIVVFLGLPVALAFSWVYDLTTEGLTRTGALVRQGKGTVVPQLALVGVTAVSGALGVLWFGMSALTAPDGGTGVEAPAPGVASFANLDPNAPITAVAVLPLADFAEDNDFFARQLHEEIITQLSLLTSLRVVSRTSVERYATTDKLLPEIAAELRVQAVVTGSVAMTAENDSVRISLQLLHAPSDTHLLSRTFQREMKDILRLQTEVAVEIARTVQGELGADVIEDVEQIAEVDPEAHRAFLMGQAELERGTPGGLEAVLAHSDRAVTIDSTFAPAWAQWAGARLVMAHEGGALSPDDLARVQEALRRATRFGGAEDEVNAGMVLLEDYLAAGAGGPGEELERATDSIGRRYVWESTRIGRRSRPPSRSLAAARFMEAGQFDSAAAAFARIVEAEPGAGPAWSGLETSHLLQGDYAGAVDVRAEWILATRGESPEARAAVQELREAFDENDPNSYWQWRREYDSARLGRGERVPDVEVALTAVGLGDIDSALAHLASAVQMRDPALLAIRNNPLWDPLRSDPRFQEIARGMRDLWRRSGDAPGGRRGGPPGEREGSRGPG